MGVAHQKPGLFIGSGTIVLLALPLLTLQSGQPMPLLFAALFLVLICVTDTLRGKIPNFACLTAILAAFSWHGMHAGWSGVWFALLGLVAGFFLLLLPYLLGGMGAGDVKALAALGALLGAAAIFQVFLYTALAGGALAVLQMIFRNGTLKSLRAGFDRLRLFLYTRDPGLLRPGHDTRSQRFPYAAAIALGFLARNQWGDLIKF